MSKYAAVSDINTLIKRAGGDTGTLGIDDVVRVVDDLRKHFGEEAIKNVNETFFDQAFIELEGIREALWEISQMRAHLRVSEARRISNGLRAVYIAQGKLNDILLDLKMKDEPTEAF